MKRLHEKEGEGDKEREKGAGTEKGFFFVKADDNFESKLA